MSIHCSQGAWRAVGCPHHLHPMQRMQAAASRRHATGQRHVVQGTKKSGFVFGCLFSPALRKGKAPRLNRAGTSN